METAIWRVVVANEEHGPLTGDEVREYLTEGKLSGNDLIWRPGFHDWKAVSDTREFWQPPPRATTNTSIPAAPTPVEIQSAPVATERPYEVREPRETKAFAAAPKWSLWKAANWGLVVSAITLLVQVGNGRGYEIARYSHAENIAELVGRILSAPLLFIVVTIVRNVLKRRPSSPANPVFGAATFSVLLVVILCVIGSYAGPS